MCLLAASSSAGGSQPGFHFLRLPRGYLKFGYDSLVGLLSYSMVPEVKKQASIALEPSGGRNAVWLLMVPTVFTSWFLTHSRSACVDCLGRFLVCERNVHTSSGINDMLFCFCSFLVGVLLIGLLSFLTLLPVGSTPAV